MSETVFAESQRRWRENCTLKTKIESLERQLEEVREYMEEHDCLEDFNEWKNR